MSIEHKRMQQRFGTYNEFEQHEGTLLPNEFASIISGFPDTDDGTALFFKAGTSKPQRIATQYDIQKITSYDKRTISSLVSFAISAVNPNYKKYYYTATIAENSTFIPISENSPPYFVIDGSGTDFDVGTDGLLILLNGVIMSPALYTVSGKTERIHIEFHMKFELGQTLNFTLYHKPKTNGQGGSIVGQATILANGTESLSIASGSTIFADGHDGVIIAGIAEEITD